MDIRKLFLLKLNGILGLIFLVAMVIVLSSSAYANSFNPNEYISGVVKDAETGEILAGVNVVIEGSNLGSITDLKGYYLISRVRHGKSRVIFSFMGYKTLERVIHLEHNENVELNVEMEKSVLESMPVVYTATKTKRFVRDVPVRTEVITSEDLKRRAVGNIYEALEGTPGVRVEQQCSACNFAQIRMNGLGNDHTQVLIDGAPVYTGLASIYGLQQMSTSGIQQIEIIKGSGSALYGSNAIAGAINIITQKPEIDKINIGMELGDFSGRKADFSAGFRSGKVATFVSASVEHEGYIDVTGDGADRDEVYKKDNATDRVESDVANVGVNFFVDDALREGDELTFRIRYLNETRTGGETIDGLLRNPFAAGTEHIKTDRYTTAAEYNYPMDWAELNFSTSFTKHERSATNDTYLGDYMATHNDEMPPVEDMRPYKADENVFSGTVSMTVPWFTHNFLGGIQYRMIDLDESGRYVVVDESDPDYGVDYTSLSNKVAHDIGFFLQDEWRFSERTEAIFGVRYDIHESESEFEGTEEIVERNFDNVDYSTTSINPRVSLRHRLGQDLTLRAGVGTGYKVPFGFSEDLHLCSGSPRVWKSSNLDPEKSTSFNFSADYQKRVYSLSFSAYMTQLVDAVGFVDAGPEAAAKGYDYEYQNIDDATVLGFDIAAKYQPNSLIMLEGFISYYSGEYDSERADWEGTPYYSDSKYISRFPTTSGGLRTALTRNGWAFNFEALFTGEMYIDYAVDGEYSDPGSKIVTTDPFVIMNTKLGYTFNNKYELYVGVRNLGDYVQTERHTDDAAFIYGPLYGRIAYTGFRVTL